MPPKRRRYHGLYFHSSPPKILPMNGNTLGRQRDDINDGLVVKPSNIRIWIHDTDIGKLTRVLWAGQGNRLRVEASTNPRVRRFLENVPYFLNIIKSVHQAVIDNDLEMLQNKLDDPPPALVTTKDANGLSVMHKAAGLGHTKIVEYLIRTWPNGVSTIDATGKTPLHWAASAKDNIRVYNLLVQAGAWEDDMDYRMKVPQYYRMKPNEIDKSFLYVVPDAPRIPQYSQPDWSTLVDDIGRLEGSMPKFYYPDSRRNSDAGNNVNKKPSTNNSIENISEPDYYNREESPNNTSTIDIESKDSATELTNGNIPNGNITPTPTPPSPLPALTDTNDVNDNSSKNLDDNEQDVNTDDIEENQNFVNKSGSGSPSPPLEIEGLIQGEADDNQVQSQSAEIDDETKIKSIIESGDMEQLALIVLNGEGNKLMDMKSNQPEIQAFLDNVPAYMNKIRRVHQAARDGNLRDLQSALDRRKFAIAKNEISPNGATPLHVATVFGHAGIVRYLAGRFPETTTAVDENGRTALHYAATVNDNGHFYNLLSHFGANPKATDKLGNIPDFYKNQDQSKGILGHKQLLKNFGANESLEEEMLNDQVNEYLEIPIFKTEQGRYLASSKWLNFLKLKQPLNLTSALGDPLIKALTEIVENRPSDPVLYLTEFLQNYMRTRDQKSNIKHNNNNNNMARISNTRDIQNIENGLNSLDIDDEAIEFKNFPQYQQSSTASTAIPIKPEPPKHEHQNEQDSGDNESTASPPSEDRDEHGQSILHFACARTHGRNALFNLIGESNIDLTYRDELYRTARDVSLQASQPGNAKEIDRYVLSLAVLGDKKPFEHFVIAGYDHILDVTDDSGNGTIFEIAQSRGHHELHNYLQTIREFEENREELHQLIRNGNFDKIKELTGKPNTTLLIKAKNYFGRTAMHLAVLKENEEIVEYFVNICPDTLKIGDNLERMPLHYAMGVNSVEIISRLLIKRGAQRTAKDLKGRQPSYYFMNKADILRLQEEEDTY